MNDTIQQLRSDQRQRWLRGERPLVESYLQQHPSLADDVDGLLDLIYAEYCLRDEAGEAPRAGEYATRFPHLAERLEPVLAVTVALGPTAERAQFDCRDRGEPDAPHSKRRPQDSTASEEAVPATLVLQNEVDVNDGDGGPRSHGDDRRAHKRLGKFELLELCGQGAFGAVYRALDTSIGRLVALKVPRSGRLASPEDENRFLREARAVAQLRHKHIVTVFEAGRIQGTPYIASEFVHGSTLDDFLKQHRLSPAECVEITRQIALALQVAHDDGVVHRDIKPANVMLESVSSEPGRERCEVLLHDASGPRPIVARLMDFGLARRDAREAYVTVEGQILGTPAYMSPEQARGDSRLVDGRSDVFGLGALFYELLTGELPFRGNVRMVLQQVLTSDPKPVRQIDDGVPLDLQTVCHKCLEKDPDKRYRTAGDLAEDLLRFQRGFPVTARPVSVVGRGLRWCQRHRLVTTLSAAVVAALVLGVIGTTWQLVATLRAERVRTRTQLDLLQEAPPAAVPALLVELAAYSDDVEPEVRRSLADPLLDEQSRVRLQLFLSQRGPTDGKSLFDAMLKSPFSEAILIRDILANTGSQHVVRARDVFANGPDNPPAALRAASYLASIEREPKSWLTGRETFLTAMLIDEALTHTDEYGAVERAFSPVGSQLQPSLELIYRDSAIVESRRRIATSLLLAYVRGDSSKSLQLLLDAEGWQLPLVLNSLSGQRRVEIAASVRQIASGSTMPESGLSGAATPDQAANAALALVWWGETAAAREILLERPDRSARSFFIDRYRRAGLSPRLVVDWADKENDPFIRSALVLILGTFPLDDFPLDSRQQAEALIDAIIKNFPTGGAWAAAAWTRTQWNLAAGESSLAEFELSLAASQGSSKWQRAPNGHIMLVQLPGPFPVSRRVRKLIDGSRADNPPADRVTRPFAISMFETTVRQYRASAPDWSSDEKLSEDQEWPVSSISGQAAAEYCNWLSARAGLPQSEWCYIASPRQPQFLESASNLQERKGFRLPTETEWEYACRAGSATSWHFGDTEALLPNYAWCPQNSPRGDKHPVGLRMPNDGGLFDLYGNADEICDDDPGREYPIKPGGYFVTRGGAAGDLDSREDDGGNFGFNDAGKDCPPAIGFRVCQSVFVDDAETAKAADATP